MDKRLYMMFNILWSSLVVLYHGNTAADCAERSQYNELAKWIRRYASIEVQDAIKMPDHLTDTSSMKQWNIILNAYQLLQSYWDSDQDLFDCQIRILSRNAKLMEHERLCWYDDWHNEQEQLKSLEENSNINTELAEFQSRLLGYYPNGIMFGTTTKRI